MNLFVDFDGVMVDTISAICSLYNEDYKYYREFKHVEPCDINTWNFKELTLLKKKELYRYFNQPRFFKNLELMAGVENAFGIIDSSCKFDTNIVTIGDYANLEQKKAFIREHHLNRFLDGFIGIESNKMDKSSVDMSGSILIDDHIKNLESSNADVKICFGDKYEYNKKWDGIRCYNWIDVISYLDCKGLL